ncbi:MAG: dual specificity protein phosphatase family protein [Candidatus Riflebacteria bacterium]|nr:dual specificity protein phosphatase family protein [Candidatus Riflebacteria bacterium]
MIRHSCFRHSSRFLVLSMLFICWTLVSEFGAWLPLTAAYGETTQIGDKQALLELQQIVAKKPAYSPEVAKHLRDLIFQLWEKPGFRHQTATLMNMNHGYVDAINNRFFLESLPPSEKDLPNFGRVDAMVFRGGQPTETGFRRLKNLGVETIINLRAEDSSEEAIVKELGMQYHWLPIPDTNTPTETQIDQFLSLMRSKTTGKVYVHCAAGRSRTGTMIALWRIENGMKTSEALAEAVKYHFNENHLAADREAALIRSYKRRHQ